MLHNLHETHTQVAALTQLPFDKRLQPRYADVPEKWSRLRWVQAERLLVVVES